MSVLARQSVSDDRLFDERSLGSVQPSDEWGNNNVGDEREFDKYGVPEDDVPEDERSFYQSNAQSTAHKDSMDRLKDSFFANQSSLVDYIADFVPTFSVEGSKITELGRSISTATFSKFDTTKLEAKAKRFGSSHSRCIIENPESIQERQDEQLRRSGKGGEEDDVRDQTSTMSSVEEISQISELTMDMPTVVTEQRFVQCSALPTIPEVKAFNSPQISATCASGVVRGKAQCVAAADTAANKIEGNSDFLDYVFELVEDAVCKPLKTSKFERKKVFMEAFHEESEKMIKLANKNRAKESSKESSKHSRSSTSTKRTVNKPKESLFPMDEDEGPTGTNQVEMSVHSTRKSDHSRIKMVDKPPLQPPGFNSAYPLNEELTIDWSKMMSLAEKQLEEEGRSVCSTDSRISDVSGITENPSMFQSVKCDSNEKYDASVISDKLSPKANPIAPSIYYSSITSTVSTSSSTHAALADDVVRELRELSAVDSSSFEEESRFLLTSSLFRFCKSLVPSFDDLNKKRRYKEMEYEERAFDEVSVASIPLMLSMDEQGFTYQNEKVGDEEMMIKIVQYVAFFYAFVFWPSGIARREIPQQHLMRRKRLDNKPTSLLQLVNEK